MLTSDFVPYSETDSLVSSSSGYLSSEIDPPGLSGNENDTNSSNSAKKRSKSRQRSQKKVKYWTLPTMSTGTFNPSMLTARQQLQYLAQKSKLGEESESLELSPLRLDRIKFEEMKSMNSREQAENNFSSKPQMLNNPSSPLSTNYQLPQTKVTLTSPSSRSKRSSKLKEELASSPLRENTKIVRDRKSKTIPKPMRSESIKQMNEISDNNKDNISNDITNGISNDITNDITNDIANDIVKTDTYSNVSTTENTNTNISKTDTLSLSSDASSIFDSVRNLFFDYNGNRRKHFENFLKNFANRLGLSVDDEIVQRKREEIINKGMI